MVIDAPLEEAQTLAQLGGPEAALEARPERRWLRSLKRNRWAMGSAVVLAIITLMAIFAPWIVPHDPKFIDPSIRLLEPSSEYRFGTDEFGRDVLSRVIYGARVSLLIGVTV